MVDYKKYSLEKLEEWRHDAMSNSETTPQEVYDTIKKAVQENIDAYQKTTERCQELLALLNGNGKGHLSCDKDDSSPECMSSWNSFWKDDVIKEDKVVKWQLPVEIDAASDDYYVTFPDDLLEAANLKEGDNVEWISQGDGSYLLRKV